VLVIEDEAPLRALYETVLRREGLGALLAADGQEGLDLFRQYRQEIALVLLDVRLPGLSGPEVLAALRREAPTLRCCFLTGDPDPEHLAELQALQAEVLTKPFRLEELRVVVSRAVGGPGGEAG
jgi:DNA-binding response OmpR family regulator